MISLLARVFIKPDGKSEAALRQAYGILCGGLGVALLPSEEFRSHRLEGIAQLKLKETICKEVGAAWRSDAPSPLVNAAVQFAKNRLGVQ